MISVLYHHRPSYSSPVPSLRRRREGKVRVSRQWEEARYVRRLVYTTPHFLNPALG